MTIIDKILGAILPTPAPTPAPPQAPTNQATVPPRPYVNKAALDAASKRLGMWVMDGAGVGILTGALADGNAEVTLIRPDGSTVMTISPNDTAIPHVVVAPLQALRQARIYEIPESRRGDIARLAKLGYQN